MTIRITDSVGQLVAERPSRAAVFDRFGIDYCCRGPTSLGEACRRRGLPAEQVLAELNRTDTGPASDEPDWATRSLRELCDHIVVAHHEYLRAALPRIGGLLARVVAAHGGRQPALQQLADIFRDFSGEQKLHMFREEEVLFPMIRRMEGHTWLPWGFTINSPIGVMTHEHDQADAELEAMRRLTNGFTAPDDACPKYRALMAALAELEADMHRHVHLENNVLFPRAGRLERSICGQSRVPTGDRREGTTAPAS